MLYLFKRNERASQIKHRAFTETTKEQKRSGIGGPRGVVPVELRAPAQGNIVYEKLMHTTAVTLPEVAGMIGRRHGALRRRKPHILCSGKVRYEF